MKIILSLFFLFLILSCNRHQSETFVLETEVFKKTNLDQKDFIMRAFIERDYETLRIFFEEGVSPNILIEGESLLGMGINARDFKMINFLMENNADPHLEIQTDNKDSYTPREMALSIEDENMKEAILALLDSNISVAGEFIYYHTLNNIHRGETLDLQWFATLLSTGVDHRSLTKAEFIKIYIRKVGEVSNYKAFYNQLTSLDKDTLPPQWKTWVEHPFTTGKYHEARCTFVTNDNCETFHSFLESCLPKARNKLEKIKPNILYYLNLRNALLFCPYSDSEDELMASIQSTP